MTIPLSTFINLCLYICIYPSKIVQIVLQSHWNTRENSTIGYFLLSCFGRV